MRSLGRVSLASAVAAVLTFTSAHAAVADSLNATLHNTVLVDEPGDGAVWSRGLTYKASFAPDGFTFFPFLGSDAPRNFPVKFTISSVTIGNQPITFNTAATPMHSGNRITIDRGAFTEAYDLAPQSIEQSFIVHERPALAGDLVVQLSIDSELPASATPDQISFTHERGSVTYSQAVVVDALQQRSQLSTSLNSQNNTITITVPRHVLDRSEFPIVIDPVIATFGVDQEGVNAGNPDVAYEVISGSYGFCWEVFFSATDSDVYLRRYSWPNFVIDPKVIEIDFTNTSWERPRIAGKPDLANFLVVAQRGAAPNRAIWGRVCTAISSGSTTSAQFEISDPGATGDKHSPDVGGDSISGGVTAWTVVWERNFSASDHDIHSRRVTDDPPGPTGLPTLIENSGAFDAAPAISAYSTAGGSNQFLVVWERTAGSNFGDIYGAYINATGTIVIPAFGIAVHNLDNGSPSVSCANSAGINAVAYEAGTADVQIDFLQSTALIGGGTMFELGSDPGTVQWMPSVETDGSKFVIAWADRASGKFANDNIWMQSFCAQPIAPPTVYHAVPAEARRPLALTTGNQLFPRIATRASFIGNTDSQRQYMATWDNSFSFSDDVPAAAIRGPMKCCPADCSPIGGDGVINIQDLLAVIAQWNSFCTNCSADVNGDLAVNITDLLATIAAWGTCPL